MTLQNFLLAIVNMMESVKLTISKDNPCLFITAVANHRLPVFRTDFIKTITCKAIDEARLSCGFLLFAYVLMPDHFHVITDCPRTPSTLLRFVKGIVSRRVLGYLKEMNYETSLKKLEHDNWKRNHRYSLWQHDSDVFSIFSESTFMQKVNYIHLNPVRAGLVERVKDYRWSSARVWARCPTDDEPLKVDFEKIVWRRS
jgi:REP element-mobilizing transposase RayT